MPAAPLVAPNMGSSSVALSPSRRESDPASAASSAGKYTSDSRPRRFSGAPRPAKPAIVTYYPAPDGEVQVLLACTRVLSYTLSRAFSGGSSQDEFWDHRAIRNARRSTRFRLATVFKMSASPCHFRASFGSLVRLSRAAASGSRSRASFHRSGSRSLPMQTKWRDMRNRPRA